LVAAGLAAAVAASAADAAVIFDSGPPNVASGMEMSQWVEADDFVLSAAATLSDVHFWTLENLDAGSWDGTLQWHIFADANGLPASAPIVSGDAINIVKTATGNTSGVYTQFQYDFDLDTPVALAGGTTFWLALHAGDDFDVDNIHWQQTSPGFGGLEAFSFEGAFDDWTQLDGVQLAFFLTGEFRPDAAVPEPSLAGLLGLAVVGLGALRRRRG
jgi:hypothetical protein